MPAAGLDCGIEPGVGDASEFKFGFFLFGVVFLSERLEYQNKWNTDSDVLRHSQECLLITR